MLFTVKEYFPGITDREWIVQENQIKPTLSFLIYSFSGLHKFSHVKLQAQKQSVLKGMEKSCTWHFKDQPARMVLRVSINKFRHNPLAGAAPAYRSTLGAVLLRQQTQPYGSVTLR